MYCGKCGTQIEENSLFCPNCGNNLSGLQKLETKTSIGSKSVPVKKRKSKLLVLSVAFATIGVIVITLIIISLFRLIPIITGSPITPSIDDNSSNNVSTVCNHSYMLKETKATCSSGGYATYQCSLCNETKKEYETALGHDWSNNTCKRCGVTKDLELDPQNNDILTIEQIDWEINSAEGVEPSITCTNHTQKQIAYIYFTVKFYDRMGTPAYCSIRHEHTRRLKVTGPIDAGEKDTYYWDPIIYNGSTAAIKPLKIEIEFTDGTKQTINCTGRFWYSKSYYGGALKD